MSENANEFKITKIDPNFASATVEGGLTWWDAGRFPVQGQAWPSESARWTRLPDRVEERVRPPVWILSRCSTGLYVDFETDSPSLAARWTVGFDKLAMPHMPATGVSGLDLYEWIGNSWRWAANGRPDGPGGQSFEKALFEKRDRRTRKFRLYFPLYNSLDHLELGVESGSELRPLSGDGRFVLVYGTSIVQGGCASRPGMAYPAILGRDLALPVVNLGFSGNALAEKEVAELLAELRPLCLVVDCLPNVPEEGCEERLRTFLTVLAQNARETRLLFVDFPELPKMPSDPAYARRIRNIRQAARSAFEAVRGGLPWHWLEGDRLLGDDGEATVDGVHPTDLGFQRMAAEIGPALKNILGS
jgi:hypothetical protein